VQALVKGGNSDILCDQFLKGAAESGNEIEKINLGDKNISPCVSCYVCQETKKCVKKDDMEEILEKLLEADGTVNALRGFTVCLPGSEEKGIVLGIGTYEKGDVLNHPAFESAYKFGKTVGDR
jgi:hypothetical protein